MPKISELDPGATLDGTEKIPATQAGVTKEITTAQISNYVGSSVSVASALEIDNSPIVVVTDPTQDFLDRLVTPPSGARETLYRTMIDALVDAGVLDKLDCLYLLAAADQATAKTNLVQTAYTLTGIGTPTFTADVGFTGNGNSGGGGSMRLDSGFSPSIVGPAANLVRNSCSLFAWSNTSGQQSTLIGTSSNGTTPALGMYSRYADDFAYAIANGNPSTGSMSVASADGKGLWSASRTGAAVQAFYKNGASVASNAAASTALALITGEIGILGFAGWMSGHQCLAAGWGAGLDATENLALYTALHTYLQAVAGIA